MPFGTTRRPRSGRKALQVYVSQLRKTVGKERLLTRAPGVPHTGRGGRARPGALPDSRRLPGVRRRPLPLARPGTFGLHLSAVRTERDRRASRSCGSPAWKTASRTISQLAAPRPSSASSSRSSARTRSGSGSADSSCWRCTAPGDRQKLSTPIRPRAARSWTSSASSPSRQLRELQQAILAPGYCARRRNAGHGARRGHRGASWSLRGPRDGDSGAPEGVCRSRGRSGPPPPPRRRAGNRQESPRRRGGPSRADARGDRASSAAAGKAAGHPRTGRGCSPSASTSGTSIPMRFVRNSDQEPSISRR